MMKSLDGLPRMQALIFESFRREGHSRDKNGRCPKCGSGPDSHHRRMWTD